MLHKLSSRQMNWLILIGMLLLILELSFSSGTIFLLFVGIGCIYVGRSKSSRTVGKTLYWTGVIFVILSVLGMITVRLFLIVLLVYLIIHYARSKHHPQHIEPEILDDPPVACSTFSEEKKNEDQVRKNVLFKSTLFGRYKTPEHVYEWNDINIISGIGDTVIDLSFTVLPQGESVIIIRHVIGNVFIQIPYDLEVHVQHSAVLGKASVFDYHEPRMINQTLDIRTGDYERARQKSKNSHLHRVRRFGGEKGMSILQRQMLIGIAFSFIITALITGIYFYLFPPTQWSDLLDVKLFDLPIMFFIPGVCFSLGIAYGLMSGLYWRNALRELSYTLHRLEQGQSVLEDHEPIPEMDAVFVRIHNIQKQIQEQTKQAQKLVNIRAEEEERMKEVVSRERNRLARELHDSVSQQLFAASMLMSAIVETRAVRSEQEEKQLRMVENMIHQSQLEMRALLLHLRPVALKGKSLQEGIEELLQELAQKVPLEINWETEQIELDKGVEDHLFRILQESVSNTLRHAKASTLEVRLMKRDHFVILRVIDDGIGFDVGNDKTGSYGIQNMYERALEIGGRLKLVSVRNQGTRLEVKVPIVMEGDDEA